MMLRRLALTGLLLSLTACSWRDSNHASPPAAKKERESAQVVRPHTPSSRHEPPASSRGRYTLQRDAPPPAHKIPRDLMMIPDAIPIDEPRSRGGNGPVYTVFGETYVVKTSASGYRETGGASWYGQKFHGHLTANGETYDMFAMTAAHKTLPIPSYVRVTHLENGKSVVVRVNDRGPFHSGRIIDLSYAAAARLDMLDSGSAQVMVEVVAPPSGPRPPLTDSQTAQTSQPSAQLVTASMSARPDPTPTVSDAGMPVGYWQAGAFSLAANAGSLYESLKSAAIRPVAIHELLRGDERWHRVVVGPFSSQAEGEAARQRLVASGVNPQWIIAR